MHAERPTPSSGLFTPCLPALRNAQAISYTVACSDWELEGFQRNETHLGKQE